MFQSDYDYVHKKTYNRYAYGNFHGEHQEKNNVRVENIPIMTFLINLNYIQFKQYKPQVTKLLNNSKFNIFIPHICRTNFLYFILPKLTRSMTTMLYQKDDH